MIKIIQNIFSTKERGTIAILLFLMCSLPPFLLVEGYAQSLPAAPTETEGFWLWKLLGRLHPSVVHFPVSLLLLAAFLELFTLKHFNSKLRPGINTLISIGALSAVLAAVLGYLLASQEEYGGDILAIHQWTGIATACLGAVTLFFLHGIVQRNQTHLVGMYRGILFFTAIGVSVAGHFGGSLTHGSDYLTSVIPGSDAYRDVAKSTITFTSLKGDTTIMLPKNWTGRIA